MGNRFSSLAAPALDDHAGQVRALFDRKAADWPGKYAAGGRLAGRLTLLAGAVRALIAVDGELLDLGCGSGELARFLAAAGYRVTGCDIAPRMLDQAMTADREHAVRWVRLDPRWQMMPFPAGSLDAVIAASVLEYVPDPVAVLRECARVLRPGGILLCTVPNMAHPIRWLEWLLSRAAWVSPGRSPRRGTHGPGQYLAYLRTSHNRHAARWWHAAAQRTGLWPDDAPGTARRDPLRLLVFARRGRAPELVNTTPAEGL